MLKDQQKAAVWLDDDWARRILGAPSVGPDISRWVAIGTLIERASEGIWLESGRIEEWQYKDMKHVNTVAWKFTPPTLLLRWHTIITVLVFGEKDSDKEFGFKLDR